MNKVNLKIKDDNQLKGIVLEKPKIEVDNKKNVDLSKDNFMLKNMYEPCNLDNWIFIYPETLGKEADIFYGELEK